MKANGPVSRLLFILRPIRVVIVVDGEKQTDLRERRNPYQNPNRLSYSNRQTDSKVYKEIQKVSNTQSDF